MPATTEALLTKSRRVKKDLMHILNIQFGIKKKKATHLHNVKSFRKILSPVTNLSPVATLANTVLLLQPQDH